MYFQGDAVVYCGEKFRGDLGGKWGEVVAPVHNESGAYIVCFGGDDYVMSEASLMRTKGQPKPEDGNVPKKRKEPQVQARRGRGKQEEETD
jgi:hypothetical protein